MKPKKLIKIIVLNAFLFSGTATATADNRTSFRNMDTVDDLLALPVSELCLNGGPTSDDIELILLNGPLTRSMYQNDPTAARMVINEQSANIKARIQEKCSNPDKPVRKLTKGMFKNGDDVCKRGAPTTEEARVFINESDAELNIDKQLQAIPYEYRLVLEEGAKLNGYTLREMFIEEIATKLSQSWEKACADKSYFQNEAKNITTDHDKLTTPHSSAENYRIADKKLNDTWKELPPEKRKSLLPSQRKWIKQQAICNKDTQCLIDMTNKRITELESENAK
ncbi:lysozyme inhibitor LprI family protein [Enterobacter roggenkampii]|uniref:lysozyme inhibitor LprI family protein n=1 Tax=Enterobacter roggenkampii TaxID=1812935 RepID=UPI002019B901|nr:lysozyme inhibitor LprI family protein [Enterobacter roggenkampii]UQQ43764.1 lysozyme inhibitor LprI family protein [Enterobacter roggenkampii]